MLMFFGPNSCLSTSMVGSMTTKLLSCGGSRLTANRTTGVEAAARQTGITANTANADSNLVIFERTACLLRTIYT